MTTYQALTFLVGMILVGLSAAEFWSPQAKAIVG